MSGEITSDKRDTIYIVSDYAQYNSVNLNSKFLKCNNKLPRQRNYL